MIDLYNKIVDKYSKNELLQVFLLLAIADKSAK